MLSPAFLGKYTLVIFSAYFFMQLVVPPFPLSPKWKFKIISNIPVFSHTEIIAKSCYSFFAPFGPYLSLFKLEKISLTNLCYKVLYINCSVLTWFELISPAILFLSLYDYVMLFMSFNTYCCNRVWL